MQSANSITTSMGINMIAIKYDKKFHSAFRKAMRLTWKINKLIREIKRGRK